MLPQSGHSALFARQFAIVNLYGTMLECTFCPHFGTCRATFATESRITPEWRQWHEGTAWTMPWKTMQKLC